MFPLPLAYKNKIRAVDGVRDITTSNWFGGVYKEPKNFFPSSPSRPNPPRLYPEYVLDDERRAFLRDRRGAIVGSRLAATYGFKVGDIVALKGTIFPGPWNSWCAASTAGRPPMSRRWFFTGTTSMKPSPRIPWMANQVGVFVVAIDPSGRPR